MTIAPEVVERMEGLVRRIAEKGHLPLRDHVEARAIVALLPEPIDPDWEVAGDMANQLLCGRVDYSERNGRSVHAHIYQGIKRGRELERSGK